MNEKANGFTLVEILISMFVLSFGLLAMAASTAWTAKEIRMATFDTQRAVARERAMEYLRALPYDSVYTSSGSTFGAYTISWSVSSPNNNLKNVSVFTSGNAVREGSAKLTVVDTMTFNIMRP